MTTERILLPVDLTGESRHLVAEALRFSAWMEASLHVVHVVPRIDNYSTVYMPGISITKMELLLRRNAQFAMDAFIRTWFDETRKFKAAVLLGDVAQELIRYIGAEAITMVIMGNHSRTGLTRFMHGSISGRVVRECRVPVLLFNLYQPHPSPCPTDPCNRPSQYPLPS